MNKHEIAKEIKNILIKLTDVTGFDHSDAALEAFFTAEDKLLKLLNNEPNN